MTMFKRLLPKSKDKPNTKLQEPVLEPKETQMTEKQIREISRYITAHLAQEGQNVDLFSVRDAIHNYFGGLE